MLICLIAHLSRPAAAPAAPNWKEVALVSWGLSLQGCYLEPAPKSASEIALL